ncbi:MAG: presqualene diphosphate synthase HpnD [Magnetococcales bacterium]|nr:presqualene diphosphate synthase HpnD [Magnetococcales bacterium]
MTASPLPIPSGIPPPRYCLDRTRQANTSFFYPMLFLPKARRQAMYALYAYCREVDDVVDSGHDETHARERLSWWQKELTSAFDGESHHPVTQEVARISSLFRLPREPFFIILEGMAMDLEKTRYESLDELIAYCQKVAVAVGVVAMRIFTWEEQSQSPSPEQQDRLAYHLGTAFQLTNILRDVAEDAELGRIYLPREILAQHGVSDEQILNRAWSPALGSAMASVGQVAASHYEQAERMIPLFSKRNHLLPALVMSGIYRTYLTKLEKSGFNPFTTPVTLTIPARLWIAWRIWRSEKKRLHAPLG